MFFLLKIQVRIPVQILIGNFYNEANILYVSINTGFLIRQSDYQTLVLPRQTRKILMTDRC